MFMKKTICQSCCFEFLSEDIFFWPQLSKQWLCCCLLGPGEISERGTEIPAQCFYGLIIRKRIQRGDSAGIWRKVLLHS